MLDYTKKYESESNWIVSEISFNPLQLGKCETIMCLGNGYMGVRSATEERYVREKIGLGFWPMPGHFPFMNPLALLLHSFYLPCWGCNVPTPLSQYLGPIIAR